MLYNNIGYIKRKVLVVMENKSKDLMRAAVQEKIMEQAIGEGVRVSKKDIGRISQEIVNEDYIWGYLNEAILKYLGELDDRVKVCKIEGDYLRDYVTESFVYNFIMESAKMEELEISKQIVEEEAIRITNEVEDLFDKLGEETLKVLKMHCVE